MSIPDRITPARWLLEWSLGEGRAAQKALDQYARHHEGCPASQGRGAPCSCGLDAAQARVRDAVRTAENLLAALEDRDASPTEGSHAETGTRPPQE
jgi:hypothetical protein